ncbi:acyl transferase domain-containing protein [Mycena galopus ATCC 62051]|nr:acyl transferase domain-containing protein [Mycena galopus ATCC 62051]
MSAQPLISIAGSGIGGSNGHVVLEAPPKPSTFNRSAQESSLPVLVMAGGLSPRSVSTIAEQISGIFENAPHCEYAATSTILGRRSKQMNWRSYGVLTAGSSIQFSSPQYSGRDSSPLVFVFSGQGPQHENMGRELFTTFPAFRESILGMDNVFQHKTGTSMIHDYGLFGAESSAFQFSSVWPISLTLPAIAMFQIALFDLLAHLGIHPDVVLGHSAGETAVLYASGAASKEMALELAIIRGQIFSTLETSGGTMAALSCSAKEAEDLLARYNSTAKEGIVEVACFNSPSAVAISGLERSIDNVLDLAQQDGLFGRKIRTRVPIHSSMMDACRDVYRAEVQDIFDRYTGDHMPKTSTYSTLTGSRFLGPFDAEYFWLNTRSQVLFAPTILNLGESTFIEIAPHPVLSSYLSEMATETSAVLSTVRRPKRGTSLSGEYYDLVEFLGKLTAAGHNCVDFTLLNSAACAETKILFPAYPFLKKRLPVSSGTPRDSNRHHGPINHSNMKVNRDIHPTLAEHIIRGEPIWPAAGFLEMALEFGATSLFNIEFRGMLPLSTEVPIPVDITLDGSYWRVTSLIQEVKSAGDSKVRSGFQIQRVHADGYLTFEVPPDYKDLNISEIRNRCDSYVDSDFYPSLSYFSAYGQKFQRVTNLYYNSNEALGSVRGLDGSLTKENLYVLHPAILDACFHIACYRPFHGDFAPNNYYLPSSIGEVILHRSPKAEYFPRHVYSYVQLSGWMPESMHFDVTILDDRGKRLCTLRNFELAKHQITPLGKISSPLHIIAQPVFPKDAARLTCFHEPDTTALSPVLIEISNPQGEHNTELLGADAFIFTYESGNELQLQWEFSGLNPFQELEIWILAMEGRDAAAGLCLTRALRREYLFWKIRFVSFPSTFSEDMRIDCLRTLPLCLKTEPDVIISPTGDPLVPRLVHILGVISEQSPRRSPESPLDTLDPDHARAQIIHTFPSPDFLAFGASLRQVNSHIAEFQPGSWVVGLQYRASGGDCTIDLGSTCIVPANIPIDQLVEHVPGLVTSVLGPGISTYNRPDRIRALSVLITHCDTIIGSTVCGIYSRDGLTFSQAVQDVAMLDLARLGRGIFDLILSGYVSGTVHAQVLHTLLRPSGGRLFLWHNELPRILQEDPCCVGDALRVAVPRGLPQIAGHSFPRPSGARDVPDCPGGNIPGAVFDSDKNYVILGGIGSLGAAVSVFMVQRGVRHLVVTSRSGKATLDDKKNLIARRIFAYLEGLPHLDIRFHAVDGSCAESMKVLFKSMNGKIGGCLILSGILLDGLFPTLGESEFRNVLAAKTGVLETLQQTTETSTLEFIVAFSSVTSVVGTGGQTNYCAANGALEEQVGALPNGFAFICPGILDSAFMLSEGAFGSRLKHLLEWSISTDEMIFWLDDAIGQFQRGARFERYMPNLNWEVLDRTHGMPKLGKHLVHSVQELAEGAQVTSEIVADKTGEIIRNVLNISEGDFDADVPLTAYGIDSLSAGRLSFALRSVVEVTQLQLLADVSLTDILRKFLREFEDSAKPELAKSPRSEIIPTHTLMENLVTKFTDGALDRLRVDPNSLLDRQAMPAGHNVLLTGSTGALGCHLLAQLLMKDGISHVYALIRQSTAADNFSLAERQAAALQRPGLSPALAFSEKLTVLVGDLRDPDFALASELMDELRASVTHIIHNAWRVDFMARLSEFEDIILGTYRLLDFATKSTNSVGRPSLSFISTIGVSRNRHIMLAPEAPINDAKVAVQTGYAESKWVAERLVQNAVELGLLHANVIRVGQLTGGDNGSWDTKQWIPALVQSGVHVGCLPDGDDVISWIPIGVAAAAILDMQSSVDDTFHLVHPRPTTWRAVMKPLASILDVPLVPYAEWFSRLKSTAEFTTSGDLAALKLMDFFRMGLKRGANRESMGLLPKVVASKGMHASETLMNEDLALLGRADAENWVRYWREVGFLPRAE